MEVSTSSPRVTVIIVNYNAGVLLSQCVQAVLDASVTTHIHVVDNASVDNSYTELKITHGDDSRLTMHYNDHNRGFAAASNQVLPLIDSDYVLFLNPDCLIETDTLAHFITLLDQQPAAGMAGALVCNIDGSEQAGARRSIPSPWRALVRVLHLDKWFPNQAKMQSFVLKHQPLPDKPIEIEGISGACMFVRRAALQAVGPMDERYFLHCEDLDWFMRFQQHGWAILFAPHIRVTHHKGACSQNEPLRVLWYKHRGMVRFYTKFFRRQYPAVLFFSVTAAVWARFGLLAIRHLVQRYVIRTKS